LSDLPNQAARREAIEGMWNSGAETMVIIDRGTPAGFQVVADARQQLLMLGRRQLRRARYEREVAIGSESNENECPDNSAGLGSWVLAPCPHDKPCPLHLSDNPKHFCHFSQRIERPKFLKDTKHTTRHEEDAKFSYVVIRRGQRPPPASVSSDLAGSSAETGQ
jgi:ribosomal protein RSM22 (predicted rRNA methylase)